MPTIHELSGSTPVYIYFSYKHTSVYHLMCRHEHEHGYGHLPACDSKMKSTWATSLEDAQRHGLRLCQRCEKILATSADQLYLVHRIDKDLVYREERQGDDNGKQNI